MGYLPVIIRDNTIMAPACGIRRDCRHLIAERLPGPLRLASWGGGENLDLTLRSPVTTRMKSGGRQKRSAAFWAAPGRSQPCSKALAGCVSRQ
jgi:hypothetical protein